MGQVQIPILTNYHYIKTDNNLKDTLIYIIGKYINNYSSIAIISKDEKEANEINLLLKETGIDVTNITSYDKEYNGGICTITSYLAKGLEFDGVIITDASEEKYNSNKSIDMKLLYVSMTRPLHELTILHEGEITKPLTMDSKKIYKSNKSFLTTIKIL